MALRQAGLTVPVLCLLAAPGAPHEDAIRHDVDLSAGSADLVTQIAAAASRAGKPARLHLKADTGMSRGGATAADWPDVVAAGLAAEAAGDVRIVGLWSHFACADIPGHPSIAAQLEAFRDAVRLAEARRGQARGAAPREHPGHADSAGGPVRPGPARGRGFRPFHRFPAGRRPGCAPR